MHDIYKACAWSAAAGREADAISARTGRDNTPRPDKANEGGKPLSG